MMVEMMMLARRRYSHWWERGLLIAWSGESEGRVTAKRSRFYRCLYVVWY